MKLKEKIAQDICMKYIQSHDQIVVHEMVIEGFEKAREMAKAAYKDHYLGKNEEGNDVLWWEIENDLSEMGEEEVE